MTEAPIFSGEVLIQAGQRQGIKTETAAEPAASEKQERSGITVQDWNIQNPGADLHR